MLKLISGAQHSMASRHARPADRSITEPNDKGPFSIDSLIDRGAVGLVRLPPRTDASTS